MRSKKWLDRQKNDFFVNEAKKKGYVSRSAFKLLEINNKFKILSNSKHVLDLGSSPGSWSQIICNINKNVKIDAFDILDMKYNNSKIKFYKKNILEFNFKILKSKYDLILSDIAPNSIGHKYTDHLRIVAIIEEVINIVNNNLQINGNFVFKIWYGSQYQNIIKELKKRFRNIYNFKPKSSRKESSEIYIIAKDFFN